MESILKNLPLYAEKNITISFRNNSDNISETVQSKPCKSRYSSLGEIADCFFPEPEEWVLIAGYVITFIVGVLGNVLVCFAVWQNREMRTTTNIFMVNLSVADLPVLLLLLPTALVADVTETWLFGTTMCKLSTSLGTMCISVSILTLCAISIERWYAICRPLSFHSSFQRARTIIATIWAVSMCVALPEFLALTVTPYRLDTVFRTMCFPALWKLDMIALFQICLMVCLYFLPLGLMACLYTQIAVVLWKKRIPGTANLRLRATTSNKHSQENNTCRLTGRKKAIKMLMAIVTVFALCFLPNHILNILRFTKQLKEVPNLRMIALISHWCMFFNSCINPIIYNVMSDKFRSEFRVATAFCCLRGRTRRLSVMYRMTTLYTRNATGQNSKTTSRITKDNP